MKNVLLKIALLVLSFAAPVVFAHHSSAMFDKERQVELTGVVTEFQWTNPHSWIQLDVTGEGGSVVHHSVELGPVRSMSRTGWTSRSLKPGDRVTLIVNPMKNGKPGGLLVRAKLTDGSVLEYTPV